MDFNFDKSALMDMAARKLADDCIHESGESLLEVFQHSLDAEISGFLSDEVRKQLRDRISIALDAEIDRVMSAEIVPVNMWGEQNGDPTTIRDQIHQRALTYWNEKVEPDRNNRGRFVITTGYGGKPRHTAVFESVAAEAFEDAIRKNVIEIVSAFKESLKADSAKFVAGEIEKHIKIPTRR